MPLPATGFFPVGQRAARSLPERWPALPPRGSLRGLKAINSRKGKGQPSCCPFQTESDMDAQTTHELVLLIAISLLCGTTALAMDDVVFTGIFAALAIGATLSAWSRVDGIGR
jgi:hypothetical protein